MFNNKKTESINTSTIIGEGIKIEGAMISGMGSLRIDGEYIGNINIAGDIIIGQTGYVKGDVTVNHALLAGKLDGNAICSTGIHLAATAKLLGNIESKALVIDDGAVFTGSCQMGSNSNNETVNKKDKTIVYTEKKSEPII